MIARGISELCDAKWGGLSIVEFNRSDEEIILKCLGISSLAL